MTSSVAHFPFSFFRIFFYPDACKPFHHDLQWRKCRRGWRGGVGWVKGGGGVEGVGGGTRGTVFTANDEEHTVVFRRSDICRSQTCGKLGLTTKALTESSRLVRC